MKNYLLIGLALVVGVLVALLFRPAPTPKPIGDLTPDQENELRASLVEMEGYADSLYRELQQSKANGIEAQTAFKIGLQAKNKEIATLKASPKVIEIQEAEPEIDDLITAQDTLIDFYQNRIVSLTNELQLRDKINAQLQANFEKRLSDTEGLLLDKEKEASELQGQNKKLRRKLFFTKVTGIIIISAVVALSL